jgi:hypothetical protein
MRKLVAQGPLTVWSMLSKKWKYFIFITPSMTCMVIDTEAMMEAASRKFVEHSEGQNGRSKWHGCIDHLLKLITRIAFTDTPKTMGTMSACHSIIYFFNSSPQVMSKLLLKQVEVRAVKPIQDLVTRWWRAYSMMEWWLRLKMYLVILEEEVNFSKLV